MTITSDDVRKWPVVDGWSISPGVPGILKGQRVIFGDRAGVGEGASVGDWVSVGDRARVAFDFGMEQRRLYGRCGYIREDGIFILQAGCHHFALAEARGHWGATAYPDKKRAAEYLALCDYAEALAKIHSFRI